MVEIERSLDSDSQLAWDGKYSLKVSMNASSQ